MLYKKERHWWLFEALRVSFEPCDALTLAWNSPTVVRVEIFKKLEQKLVALRRLSADKAKLRVQESKPRSSCLTATGEAEATARRNERSPRQRILVVMRGICTE
jgi:hypothetical protein